MAKDMVNHPDHYTSGKIEVIDIMEDQLSPEEYRGYIKGQVIKYITRESHKNGLEDLKKAQWYLNRLIAKLDKDMSFVENSIGVTPPDAGVELPRVPVHRETSYA